MVTAESLTIKLRVQGPPEFWYRPPFIEYGARTLYATTCAVACGDLSQLYWYG